MICESIEAYMRENNNKNTVKNICKLFATFIAAVSVSCVVKNKNIPSFIIPAESSVITISSKEETTFVFRGDNFTPEDSFYMTSFDPSSMNIGEISLDTIHGINSMVKKDDYIYLSSYYRNHTFMILKILDTGQAKTVFTYDNGETGDEIRINGNYLFIVTRKLDESGYNQGYNLLIFNIKNPASPELITRYKSEFFDKEKPFYIVDLYFDANLLYILGDNSFLCFEFKNEKLSLVSRLDSKIPDRFNPILGFKNKKLLTFYSSPKLMVKETSLLRGGYFRLAIVDVNNPANPKINDLTQKLAEDTAFKNIKSKEEGAFPVFKACFWKNILFINVSFLIARHGFHIMRENVWTGENDLLIAYDMSDGINLNHLETFELSGECGVITPVDNYLVAISNDLKADYFINNKSNHLLEKIPENEISNVKIINDKIFLPVTLKERGDCVTKYDFKNPDKINLQNIFPVSGDIEQIKLKEDIAYIADSEQGLVLLDVSNPGKMTIINEFKISKRAKRFFIDKNLLFLADEGFGIRIIDIKDRGDLRELGEIEYSGEIRDIITFGNQIFILTENGMEILKYDSNYKIEKTGIRIPLDGRFNRINSFKNKIYVPVINEERSKLTLCEYATGNTGKVNSYMIRNYTGDKVIDNPYNVREFIVDEKNERAFIMAGKYVEIITFKPSPAYAGTVTAKDSVNSAVYEEGKLYLDLFGSIQILEERKNHFEEILSLRSDEDNLAVNKGIIYGKTTFNVLSAVKPEYRKNPEVVTVLENAQGEIKTYGKYLLSLYGGLKIYDIDDFSLIYEDEKIRGNKICQYGHFIYVIDDYETKILDISNINNPSIVSKYSYKNQSFSCGIFVTKDYAYIGITEVIAKSVKYKCVILNVSDITKPFHASEFQVEGKIIDIYVKGENAFIFENGEKYGLEIFNLADEKKPVLIGRYEKPFSESMKMIIKDNTAYLVYEGGVQIVDISNPGVIKLIKEIKTESYPVIYDMNIDNNYMYLADLRNGLVTINIEDFKAPYIINKNRTFGYAKKVCSDERYIYMAASDFGATVFHKPIKINNPLKDNSKSITLNLPKGFPEGKYNLKHFSKERPMSKLADIIVE